MRIGDNPNHPFYGPVRRLWVVFQTLFADNYAYLDEEYTRVWGEPWDATLVRWVGDEFGTVTFNQRAITKRILTLANA